jgi:ribosome maturation factor RimP
MPEPATALVERIAEIAARAARREGIDVWDIEVLGSGQQRIVRIFIDKPQGVTHGDCELVSGQVGTVLDVENVIPGRSYHLEVSSPGIERRLRTARHFQLSAGRKARVQLREPVDGQKRWEGVVGSSEDSLTLEVAPGHTLRFAPDLVEKAHLKYEW